MLATVADTSTDWNIRERRQQTGGESEVLLPRSDKFALRVCLPIAGRLALVDGADRLGGQTVGGVLASRWCLVVPIIP